MQNGTGNKTVLMIASVAGMIDSFNQDNIRLLSKMGYQLHVAGNFYEGNSSITRMEEFRQELEQQGIHPIQVPMPRSPLQFGAILKSYRMVKALSKEHQYEIVHCHSPVGSVVARLACRKERKNGTKVIYTAHGFHFYKGASQIAWMLYYPIEKFCSRFTDVLITINSEDYQLAQGLHAKEVVYVPGVGVDTEAFQNVKVDTHEKRLEFGISDEDFLFISVGELSKRKNHETAIRALSQIRDTSVKYLIVGCGPLEHDLKQLVNELGMTDRIVFAGYRSDIKELLHTADAFVFPSRQEGLPVALMEAMAVGMPVVCSRIRGNVDLIEDGKGGYLYHPVDVDGFAVGMKKIIAAGGTDMGSLNQQVIQQFDICAINQFMDGIYKWPAAIKT